MSQTDLQQQYPKVWRLEIYPDRMILQKDATGQLFGQRPEKPYSQLPRLLIADYEIASECLKRLKKQSRAKKMFGKPDLIVQWMAASEGGLSLLELRILKELLTEFDVVGIVDGKGDQLQGQIETEETAGAAGKVFLLIVIVFLIIGGFVAYIWLRQNAGLT
ncbi:hypothetical protein [Acinetobacter sp. c3-l95]|uniref:hypothetical protein n=1 Tax=Acinetobacter sp. c3-l95 TaxID=3342804 RepID=UPI0035B95DB0